MKSIHLGMFVVLALFARIGNAAETVVIAAEDDWSPYSSMKADKSGPEGFAVDIVREAFKSQGVDVKFQVLPFARCLSYAETGKVMGCFDTTVVDSNRDTYCWHPTPMFEESLLILGSSKIAHTDMKIADLEGRVVGSTTGYTYPDEFTKNKRIKHFTATSDDHLVKMLAAGRVEFILINGMPGYKRINADPALKGKIKTVGTISVDGFWVAFTKKDKAGQHYCETFEKGLQEIRKNGKYKTLETSFRKSIGL
jgi:polar amino acid transport system substrate-binding protein